MEEPRSLSVSEFLDVVNETLRMIPSQDFVVEGEVADFRISQQKWVSFDLKDEEKKAVLKCFMTTWQLKVEIEDGMRVKVQGSPKVYERFGQFKMNVQSVEPVGEGALARAYEMMKKKLEDEGLFDESRKRALPRFVAKIGLITSRDAAAFGDFVRILNNRWGGVNVEHAHVHVQGRNAVEDILFAFAHFNTLEKANRPDVLVLTRGGGGLEDLHAFNDEQVARAVYQSKIPVVVAVGHERDESLADFVADVRASTPSNAAELVVPSRSEVLLEMNHMKEHMEDHMNERISEFGYVIERVMSLVGFILERQKERFVVYQQRLDRSISDWIPAIKEHLENIEKVLRQLDPKRVLARGFSIVTVNGAVLKDVSTLEIGTEIGVQLASGSLDAEVKKTYAFKKEH